MPDRPPSAGKAKAPAAPPPLKAPPKSALKSSSSKSVDKDKSPKASPKAKAGARSAHAAATGTTKTSSRRSSPTQSPRAGVSLPTPPPPPPPKPPTKPPKTGAKKVRAAGTPSVVHEIVGEKPLLVRAGADLSSDEVGKLGFGTRLHVLKTQQMPSGDTRALVAMQGSASQFGWLTSVKDGADNLRELTAEEAAAPPRVPQNVATSDPAAPDKPPLIRGGSLVKLHGLGEKKFNGQMGRVVEMAGPVLAPDGTTELVAVLLAPKGSREGVWVAVPPENLTIE